MPNIHKYSDMHLDTWKRHFPKGHNPITPPPDKAHEDTIIINAGDQGNEPSWTDYARRLIDEAYQAAGYNSYILLQIPGNHDHWGSGVPIAEAHRASRVWLPEAFGLTIAGTTLWTNFWGRQQEHMDQAYNGIMDFFRNPTASPELYADLYEEDRAWLIERTPDVVFTHFPPTLESIHQEYIGDRLNPYFVNDDEAMVREVQARLWLHGHTHNSFTHMVGPTTIVANPMAYPGERFSEPTFRPIVIEL